MSSTLLLLFYSFISSSRRAKTNFIGIVSRLCIKPGLHLSVFAENRRERIANMISVNGCLRVFSMFGDTFSHSRGKTVFWVREKGGENSFLHFLNIPLANRRKCKPYQWFLVNIRSEYSFSPILGEWNKCKPGLRLFLATCWLNTEMTLWYPLSVRINDGEAIAKIHRRQPLVALFSVWK